MRLKLLSSLSIDFETLNVDVSHYCFNFCFVCYVIGLNIFMYTSIIYPNIWQILNEIHHKLQMIKRTNLSLFVAILLTCDSVFLVTRIIVIHIDCVLFYYYIYFHISFIFIPFHTNLTLCSLTVLLFPLICTHV